jgi:hypothetical protein
MLQRKYIKQSSNIVNLTKKPINMYNYWSGSIVELPPIKKKALPFPHKDSNTDPMKNESYYIVTPNTYKNIKKVNRTLDDIALISREEIGRNGVTITYLTWAKNPDYWICLIGA